MFIISCSFYTVFVANCLKMLRVLNISLIFLLVNFSNGQFRTRYLDNDSSGNHIITVINDSSQMENDNKMETIAKTLPLKSNQRGKSVNHQSMESSTVKESVNKSYFEQSMLELNIRSKENLMDEDIEVITMNNTMNYTKYYEEQKALEEEIKRKNRKKFIEKRYRAEEEEWRQQKRDNSGFWVRLYQILQRISLFLI